MEKKLTEANFNTPIHSRKVDIIWNSTLVCIWDCEICCVNAIAVSKKGDKIYLFDPGTKKREIIPFYLGSGSIYDQAKKHRELQGLELSFEQKILILDNLRGFSPKLDFSGGDPLSVQENKMVLEIASQRFGRNQITLTATGAGLRGYDPAEIAPFIGELNFTYDSPYYDGGENRPDGYARGNLKKASEFAQLGVKTRGECPLSIQNISDDNLRLIYRNMHEQGIDKLLVMRLFPVGRGEFKYENIPTPAQYRRAINILREEEAKFHTPRIKIQCALKFFDDQNSNQNNPCDLVQESFGLTANGILLASPWAINREGAPLADEWVLGNLVHTTMEEILQNEKTQQYQQRMNENFGHCKIFSFFHSKKQQNIDRIFDKSDPLYS